MTLVSGCIAHNLENPVEGGRGITHITFQSAVIDGLVAGLRER
jgi:hypothetical protein